MLFWGQQGVSPDIQTAVRHYERGAVRLGDPVSMYDYAIVLMQVGGQLLSLMTQSVSIVILSSMIIMSSLF